MNWELNYKSCSVTPECSTDVQEILMGKCHAPISFKIHTAAEFFISATTEVNSWKCSSGQKGRAWVSSPDTLPALTAHCSRSSLLLTTAA